MPSLGTWTDLASVSPGRSFEAVFSLKTRDDVVLGQRTDVGLTRSVNEDAFGYWEPEGGDVFASKGRVAVVCDGMGGHAGGEIASQLAVKTILESYAAQSGDDVVESLRRAIETANQVVFQESRKPENALLRGMGTTVTALVLVGDTAYFGQVGDSRAYLIRGGAIRQMTKDHSYVQQLVDQGLLDASDMEHHPDKNVILRSLGVRADVEVDISYAPVTPGDTYLLCSDGLSGLVGTEELCAEVSQEVQGGVDMEALCGRLVDLANAHGGHDNITVQTLHVRPAGEAGPEDPTQVELPEPTTLIGGGDLEAGELEELGGGDPEEAPAAEQGQGSRQGSGLERGRVELPAPVLTSPPRRWSWRGRLSWFLAGVGVGLGSVWSGAAGASGSGWEDHDRALARAQAFVERARTRAEQAHAPGLEREEFGAALVALGQAGDDVAETLAAAEAFARAAEQAERRRALREAQVALGRATEVLERMQGRVAETGPSARAFEEGRAEYGRGEMALADGDYGEARDHYRAARVLLEAAEGAR